MVLSDEDLSDESVPDEVDPAEPEVAARTVLGGVCIFNALYEFEQVQVHNPDFNWYTVTTPAGFKSGPDGNFLLGYHSVDAPVFRYADKLTTRNVGLQIWPSKAIATTQTAWDEDF